jgi:hypothetical protein
VQTNSDKVLETFRGKSFRKAKKELTTLFPVHGLKVQDDNGILLTRLSTSTNKFDKNILLRIGQFQKITSIRFE